jgi:membrane associated rhomboid family serine protease
MAYPLTTEQDSPELTPAVQWLIAINVAIYFLQRTLFDGIPAALGFEVRDLTERPWTILTYMFVHAGFLPLALGVYGLWLFGPRLERAWSGGSFTRYFIFCGLGGWLFHLLFTRTGLLVGASAGLYGVMLAYAMRWPDEEKLLFGLVPMRVRWMVVLYAAIDVLGGILSAGPGTPGVAHLAHLGGFAMGWMYLRTTSSIGSVERLRERISHVPDIPDEAPRVIPRSHPNPRPRDRERPQEIDEIVARSNAAAPSRQALTAPRPARAAHTRSEELNLVLDKISEHGLDSLTRDERRLLEEMSRRLRDD